MTIWHFWINVLFQNQHILRVFCNSFKYLILTVLMRSYAHCVCVCVCVCVWVSERGRQGHTTAACVQTHTSFIIVSVTWLWSPFGLELMVQLRTLLTVFTLVLKAEVCDYGKGNYISDVACGVRPITMHWVSWPIKADCACWKEGLCRKRSVWEKRGIEDLQ